MNESRRQREAFCGGERMKTRLESRESGGKP